MDKLNLLAAGIVLLLLFVATYSQRRTWIALGSTALTIVLVAGYVFLSTANGANEAHKNFAEFAKALPDGWEEPVLKLASSIERTSAALARARQRDIERDERPFLTASIARWFAPSPESSPAAAPEPEYAPPPISARIEAEPPPESPIKWLLETSGSSEGRNSAHQGFQVNGANVSDLPLKGVRAVLKPDAGGPKIDLVLAVEGPNGQDETVVPPGARFRLRAETLTPDEAEQLGGAILSFAYVQAGRQKTSIVYLPQPILTQAPATN